MTKQLMIGVFSAIVTVVFLGCDTSQERDALAATPYEFTVEVFGTEGLVVDLLVILKPDPGSLELAVNKSITLPYKRVFRAVKHAVWVQSTGTHPDQEGEFTLRIGGSDVSGMIRPGLENLCGLTNL